MTTIHWRMGLLAVAIGALCLAGQMARSQSLADEDRLRETSRRGNALWQRGEVAAAAQEFEKAVTLSSRVFGPESPNTATLMNDLALLYQEQGKYDRAEPLYRRSLAIREARRGSDHLDVAQSLNNLAGLYRELGQYDRAEPLYRRSLKIKEAQLGEDHIGLASTLNNLANLYMNTGRLSQAEKLYQRSLQIREENLGPNHPDVAQNLNNLAALYREQGQYDRAEPLYRRCLRIEEVRLGRDHPELASTLNNLANLYLAQGRPTQAEPYYRRSLQVHESKLGKDHPLVAVGLQNLGSLQAAGQRWGEASDNLDRARRLVRRYVARVLPGLSERDQLAFLRNADADSFALAQSVALARPTDTATVARAAGWVLNGKAISHQALAEGALLARDSRDENVGRLNGELTRVRRELAALTLAEFRTDQQAERRRRLERLSEEEQQLARQLGRAAGRPVRDDPWVDTDEVRRALPADAILIEITRFAVNSFEAKGGGKRAPRYAAWLVPAANRGDIRLIDLGAADRIDAAVTALRQALVEAPGKLQSLGEPEAEKVLRKPLAELARLVLHPLLEHIDGQPKWIISPDGALGLVPWAALPLTDGTYALETHQIQYVVSGRDLLRPAARVKPGGPRVVADPDYDLGAQAQRQPSLTRKTALNLPRVARLPGTADEAKRIRPHLERYAGAEVQVYQGRQALEGAVKEFRSPQVLVMSTHGFFLDDKGADNPLLRCGLLLAGCNRRGSADAAEEDGVLTGLEIVGMDLRGTELVVLSACDTAVGQVRDAEGVAGLRQAFQLAGARSVAATLWQVPDRDTALLMGSFFENLADGRAAADALRQAQLKLIETHRERSRAAHPFFWAAFTLTGP